MIFLGALTLFSASVIALELTPSRHFFDTTFIATLETQNVSVRLGSSPATLSGISGLSISARDLEAGTADAVGATHDLTQLGPEPDGLEGQTLAFANPTSEAHLELDTVLIPSGRAFELTSAGDKNYLSLEILPEEEAIPVEATVVWKGPIVSGSSATPVAQTIGSRHWTGMTPLIEIDAPAIDGLIYAPIQVAGLSTDRLRISGRDQIATSSLLSGDIQFDVLGYRSKSTILRTGEFSKFSGISAQLTNLTLTEDGLRFVLVGRADKVMVGFIENLRDVQPSLLEALLSIQSFVILMSSSFALLVAGLGVINLSKSSN